MKKALIALIMAAVCVLPSASIATRGLNNLNPGNIVKTDTNWQGEVECSDPRFECFSSAEYGLRAMAIILYTYRTVYGADDVFDVLYRWMPPIENPTDQIAFNVTNFVCSKYDKLSILDMIYLIVLIENGESPYTVRQIYNALPDKSFTKVYFYCNRVST